ncbi:hypothetical protein [Streptomyces sp. CB01881]|uniref:bpX5 domain-containing protein n=1 Tax=Streptomyces sp. CB01881 TaxID=2078691 RepID=UPI000CDC868A|nr:hypothetical protein [Streptomyces sp. CB01881]AUY47817.1 hypothetical protein C2142_01200 [Streptomyces sp. CB01881]TYC76291.1 hypothetical protein EH183_01195 [Streptomyces sp. CB01881]
MTTAPPSFPLPSFPLRWERREPPLPAAAVLALGDAVPALAAATRDRLRDGARLGVLADGPPAGGTTPAAAGVPNAAGARVDADAREGAGAPSDTGTPPGAPPGAGTTVLLVLGAGADLPWADGARYLGRDAGLLVPTTARPGPAAALWRRALGAEDGQLCVLVPGHALVADPPPPAGSPDALEPYTRSAER